MALTWTAAVPALMAIVLPDPDPLLPRQAAATRPRCCSNTRPRTRSSPAAPKGPAKGDVVHQLRRPDWQSGRSLSTPQTVWLRTVCGVPVCYNTCGCSAAGCAWLALATAAAVNDLPRRDARTRTFTFLGTGTSVGVPMIGCDCAVCRSTNPRNHRYRCAVLIRTAAGQHPHRHAAGAAPATAARAASASSTPSCSPTTTPTTCSAWTTCGPIPRMLGGPVPLYCTAEVEGKIRATFSYAFGPDAEQLPAGYHPQADLPPHHRRAVHGPRRAGHADPAGSTPSSTCSASASATWPTAPTSARFPRASWPLLEGLRVLVLDALRPKPHPAHFGLDQALDVDRPVPAGAGVPDAHEPRARPRGDQPPLPPNVRAGLRRADVRVLSDPARSAAMLDRSRRPAAAPAAARPGTRPRLVGPPRRRRARASCSTSSQALDLDQLQQLYAAARPAPTRCRRRSAIAPVPVVPRRLAGRPRARRLGEEALRRGEVAVLRGRRRPGQPARLRPPQGHVPRRPGHRTRRLFQIHAEKVLALRRRYGKPRAVPGHDQPRDARRDARRSSPNTATSACRRTRCTSSARGRCRPSTWRPASCCWRRRAGCSSAPTATAAR